VSVWAAIVNLTVRNKNWERNRIKQERNRTKKIGSSGVRTDGNGPFLSFLFVLYSSVEVRRVYGLAFVSLHFHHTGFGRSFGP
jgi:hypothetical protein